MLKPLSRATADLPLRVEEGQPAVGLQNISTALQNLAAYLLQLSTAERDFLRAESEAPFCTASLKATNSSIISCSEQVQAALAQLAHVLQESGSGTETQDGMTLITALDALDRLHVAFQSVCSLYRCEWCC